MDLALVEDFIELARALNFSRAAETRNLTQPAFSRRIRQLESLIGTPLVERTTRSVTLTPAGQAFLPKAESLLRIAIEARQDALAAAGLASRSLTIAATHALSYTFVPRWLMGTAGPGTLGTLNLVSDNYRECLRLLSEGEAQFIIHHKGLSDLDGQRFRSCTIGHDALIPLCAPDSNGEPKFTLDAPAPFLAYAEVSGLRGILENHWTLHGQPPLLPVLHSVLAATNLEMAKEGQGIAWLPASLAEADRERGALVRASRAHDVPLQIVITRPRGRLTKHCEELWSTIADH